MQIMREKLSDLIAPQGKLSGELESAHAGLLMQRGLSVWDKDAKSDVIERVSKSSVPSIYKSAYERWVQKTWGEHFAFTTAKIVGRLYTGLSGATALETGISVHHTYGMPMPPGSSVKGAVSSYAENIGIDEKIRQVLFGDEDNAGAVVWHDAWWIPTAGSSPFAGEIITTHHQEYYNGNQDIADEMESPVPNQQIATQGSFYFAVEGVNKAWADFANQLLFQMLENQGMGSKTASGYGYFAYDEEAQKKVEGWQQEAKQAEKEREKLMLPEHQQIVSRWIEILQAQKYGVSDQKHTDLYRELVTDLQSAIDNEALDKEQKLYIATELSVNKITKTYGQSNWINDKRSKEIKPLLAKLRGE